MMKHVVRVVSIEGPIHESEIVLRIRSAWGLARAGNQHPRRSPGGDKGRETQRRYRWRPVSTSSRAKPLW